MSEVPYARKYHCQPQAVGGFNHLRIALRAAGLDHGRGSGLRDLFDAIRKGKNASEATTVPLSGS